MAQHKDSGQCSEGDAVTDTHKLGLGALAAALLLAVIALTGCGGSPKASPPEKRAPVAPPASEPPQDAGKGSVWTNPVDGAQMVYVPAGPFLMGSPKGDPGAIASEHPQRQVHLDGYWIDKYLVTVAQYQKFCKATGRQMSEAPFWGWKNDHPIVNVTWYDAAAYAAWAGKRLPTEAEWEKAARGTDGRRYPWGNEWDPSKCANSVGRGFGGLGSTRPVGNYPAGASPYGCLDMAGNVLEWCADWYQKDYYRSAPSRNPQGPSSGERRVLRGGSWFFDNPTYFRCPSRHLNNPEACLGTYNGFRCARGPASDRPAK